MRLGLFGGTFDPIHVGHLDVARVAEQALGLDRVWLIPARVPPHRHTPQASAAHRFAMTSLAVQGTDHLLVSDVEMDVDGPSYTAETLDRLQARGVDLTSAFFIIGADAFRDIAAWRAYPAVLDRCHFTVVSRPGLPASTLRHALSGLAPRMVNVPPAGTSAPFAIPARASILLVDRPTSPISSTDVRRSLASGEPITGMVPDSVADHIRRHALYAATH